MSIDLPSLTIRKAHTDLTSGAYSAFELAEAYLKNIQDKNKKLNVYLEVFDDVLEQAREADKRIKAGTAGALTGIPMAIKDNILIEGRRVSAASRILEGYVASYDATVIKKLKEAGAVFLGRANMDEFAMGSSTENSAFGVTRNPHDSSRVAGGSSGGSAVAVAADLALAALGSDTGGSIRQPSAFCGVVGLKPTYGAVSRSGLIALGSSLDCIGPIAKTAEDVQIVFDCIRDRDPLDSTSVELSEHAAALPDSFSFGVLAGCFKESEIALLQKSVLDNFNRAIVTLEACGGKHQVATPQFDPTKGLNPVSPLSYSLPTYYIIMPAEASANLARFDGVKYGLHKDGASLLDDYLKTRAEGFGREVRRRILVGTYVLSSGYYDAYYEKALRIRELVRETFDNIFKHVPLLAWPTTPFPAWKVGEKTDPVSVYLADVFTVSANIAGLPAISIPSGFAEVDGKKLPLGLQLMAPHGREDILFEAAKRFAVSKVKS